MGEIAVLVVGFSVAGVLAGILIGSFGNRRVLLVCLGLAGAAAAVLGLQAGLNNGWGRVEQILHALLTLWGAALALVVSLGLMALRARRQGQASGNADGLP
jgi:MFS family permease